MTKQLSDLFTRVGNAPILTADMWPYPINSVMNPGAALLHDGRTVLLCRVEDRRGKSHLCVARSENGIDGWEIDQSPTFESENGQHPEELWGVEDPRVTYIPELDEYAIVYVAYSHSGPGVSLAMTKDFVTFRRCGAVLPPDDKDAALFHRKINGYWMMIHRPTQGGINDMWITRSPDLYHWGEHEIMLEARQGSWWDAARVGVAGAPIETERGWLIIYHGVKRMVSGGIYRIGAALFDLDRPNVCLKRGDSWIFSPITRYERVGDADNVVFSCGHTLTGEGGDTINMYYGAADTCIGLAVGSVKEILAWLEVHGENAASGNARF